MSNKSVIFVIEKGDNIMNKTSIINLIENAKLVLGTSTLFSFILATNHRGLIISILFTLWIASIIISKKVK